MFLPAIAACQFLPGIEKDIQIYPLICGELLPVGMLGLVIAAMFAATMSTLSSDFNVCAGVLTNDVYRRLFRPSASDRELVFTGRAMTLVIGLIAIGVAMTLVGSTGKKLFENMVTLFSIAAAPLGIPMLVGLLSRRATNLSAIVGSVGGIATGLVLFFTLPASGEILGLRWEQETALFAATVIATLAAMLVVSRVAPMGSAERSRVDGFHRRLAVPIGEAPEDRHVAAPGEVVFSPFRVVGVCVLCIGLMMLCVQPWVGSGPARLMNGALGATFVLFGGLMAWRSTRSNVDET
jgi:Na+/proline symporter